MLAGQGMVILLDVDNTLLDNDRFAADLGDCLTHTLARFAGAGVDVDALATQLQVDGAKAFVKSWQELLKRIADKSAALTADAAG